MGTVIVSIILISIIFLIIVSIIKSKRAGQHPSCGGNCGSCGHVCKASYPHTTAFLNNQSKNLKSKNYKLAKNNNK